MRRQSWKGERAGDGSPFCPPICVSLVGSILRNSKTSQTGTGLGLQAEVVQSELGGRDKTALHPSLKSLFWANAIR